MQTTTSLERVTAVLDGRVPDRVPVRLHNYLMACRMIGADLCDGEALAEAQFAAWREFGYDFIMRENGVHAETEAMGCVVLYQPGVAPHVERPVVECVEDIDRLRVPAPEKTFLLIELLKATRILVRETGGKVFINGRADQGPITLALALCGPDAVPALAGSPGAPAAADHQPNEHRAGRGADPCGRTLLDDWAGRHQPDLAGHVR